MLRILLVSFAMLAVTPGPCAAETIPPAADIRNDVRNEQPTPHSNSATGSSSDEDSAAENELLQAANKIRELAGVPPLRSRRECCADALGPAPREPTRSRIQCRGRRRHLEQRPALCSPGFRARGAVVFRAAERKISGPGRR